jgi:GT2 family glycosyltransferase
MVATSEAPLQREVEKLLNRARENPGNFISSCRQVNEKGKESKAYGIFPDFGTLTGLGRSIYKILNRKKMAEKTNVRDNLISPDWVSGSVMIIKREIFRYIGGFDEDFWMYFEDMDLCSRARDLKGEIAYYTDITIQHNHGGSSRINLETTTLTKTEVIISNHIYILKHKSGAGRFLIQSYLVFYNLMTGILSSFLGIVFFANSKMFVSVQIFGRLINYYFGALMMQTWISPRSVRFIKNV